MNRRAIYTIGIAVILFFLFFNPFKKKTEQEVQRPYVATATMETLADFTNRTYQTPEDFLSTMFKTYDIVFLGEMSQIKQQVEVVDRSIPVLYKNGIRNLGIEFALYEDQAEIDRILGADEYDSAAVDEVLFNRMVIWGYQEYADLFRTAWELNHGLPEDSTPFRIVGLNVRQNWELVASERDLKKPEIVAQVFAEGIPEVKMAEVIIREFIRKREKALIYTSIHRAFTDFETVHYTESAKDTELSDTRRTGNIIHDEIGDRSATVLMHGPWPYERAQLLSIFPANGVFDSLLEELPPERQQFGLKVAGTELGDVRIGRSDFAYKHDSLTLSDVCDGYIVTGPIIEYEVVHAIPNFITQENLAVAIRDFPGPTVVEEIDEVELNKYIEGLLQNRLKYLERFK
jgi:hypothetical protein